MASVPSKRLGQPSYSQESRANGFTDPSATDKCATACPLRMIIGGVEEYLLNGDKAEYSPRPRFAAAAILIKSGVGLTAASKTNPPPAPAMRSSVVRVSRD